MKTIISRTALKTLLLYGAFSASICYTYCFDQTIAKYHTHQTTITSEKLSVIASLEELHSWKVNGSLSLQAVLPKEELNLALKYDFDSFYEMPIVAAWSDNKMSNTCVYNVFSANPARLGYAINEQEEKKIEYWGYYLRQSRERRKEKEKEKKENMFELTSKAFLSKSDKSDYIVSLLPSDIARFLPKVERSNAVCWFDSTGKENVLYNASEQVDLTKVIALIEGSAECKLEELALLKFSLSEGSRASNEYASRERIFIVKQTDLMSTYITYRTHTDRASGIDVLTAQLKAEVICTQKLRKDVELLKTENSQMRGLIKEKDINITKE